MFLNDKIGRLIGKPMYHSYGVAGVSRGCRGGFKTLFSTILHMDPVRSWYSAEWAPQMKLQVLDLLTSFHQEPPHHQVVGVTIKDYYMIW